MKQLMHIKKNNRQLKEKLFPEIFAENVSTKDKKCVNNATIFF